MTTEPPDPFINQVEVGRIAGLHGFEGRVRVLVMSDVPNRFDQGQVVSVQARQLTIVSSQPFRAGQVILSFAGVNSSSEARSLVGQYLTIPPSESPRLPDGEYFHFQLLGLRVETTEGELLGKITEILETGSNDVYVVKGDKGEVLVPAGTGVITDVRVDEGVMLVSLPEGLR